MPFEGTSRPAHQPEDASRGRLVVICGCMFSGKTTRLIEHLEAARAAGRRVVALKHQVDDRYDHAALSTHDGRRQAAQPVAAVDALARLAAGANLLAIDEIHFFGTRLVPACVALTAQGVDVVAAGLEFDAWGQAFPHVAALAQRADAVERLHAPCARCGRPARYSQRMVPLRGTLVGGPGEYEPRCPACFEPLPAPAPVYD